MTTPKKREIMYSVDDVAEYCGVSTSTVYKWVAKGDFPTYLRLPNGQIRVLEDDLEVWLYKKRQTAA
jgi:excisionase family DNA binding protein